jgi:hypothetical protein
VRQESQAPQRALALEPRRQVVGQADPLEGGAEHELPRVQDERLVGLGLDQPGEFRLVGLRVDEGVLVVVEQAEVAVESHVDG